MSAALANPKPQVCSVSQLTEQIKESLAERFAGVWVTGELSEVSRPSSGHIYVTLKDETSQLRGVLWRNTASRLRFDLREGQQVVCCGDVDVFPPRGTYQLIIRQIEPLGVGALQLAFQQLRERLTAEGLFDPRWKKSLPAFPRRIAFVTSPSGAAVRDFLQVASRRWRGVQLTIVPAKVQGEGAADDIVRGIEAAHRLDPAPEVIVVGRGGGSIEDLWCFNEEKVVRAIFAARIPVVSAVGHEIDVTLSDLVADVRALTPSEAAERIVPSVDEIHVGLKRLQMRLGQALRGKAQRARQRLEALASRRIFRRPFDIVQSRSQRIDDLSQRIKRAIKNRIVRSREKILARATQLESLSPLGVLSRGYSVTLRATTGEVVRDAESLKPGDRLTTKLARGEIASEVVATTS